MGLWTDADVARQQAKFKAGGTLGRQTDQNGQEAPDALKTPPRASEGHFRTSTKVDKGHKYRAEPCIVTADLTLFTRADVDAAEAAGKSIGCDPDGRWVKTAPLQERANACGIVGDWFGSLKEGRRWIALRHLEQAGLVKDLQRQQPYELTVNGVRLGVWNCDFRYSERVPAENMARVEWNEITEDTKGHVLPLDKWKRAHVEAQYQIKIRIT